MELDKMITLIKAVSDSALTGFVLDEGNMHLELSKVPKQEGTVLVQEGSRAVQTDAVQSAVMMQSTVQAAVQQPLIEKTILQQETADSTALAAQSAAVQGTPVCSPLVGTFYTAPSENEPAFVKVGDRVTKGQTLGIIEAMKLMNEIEAEQDGVITEILVENEQMVEYGQKLFMIS